MTRPGEQPQYPLGGYPPAPKYVPTPPPEPIRGVGSGMAVTALILGILAILGAVTVVIGFVFGIVGAILGFVAIGRANRGAAGRKGMAVTGVVLSVVGIVLSILMTFWAVWVWNEAGISDYLDCIDRAPNRAAEQICSDQLDDRLRDAIG